MEEIKQYANQLVGTEIEADVERHYALIEPMFDGFEHVRPLQKLNKGQISGSKNRSPLAEDQKRYCETMRLETLLRSTEEAIHADPAVAESSIAVYQMKPALEIGKAPKDTRIPIIYNKATVCDDYRGESADAIKTRNAHRELQSQLENKARKAAASYQKFTALVNLFEQIPDDIDPETEDTDSQWNTYLREIKRVFQGRDASDRITKKGNSPLTHYVTGAEASEKTLDKRLTKEGAETEIDKAKTSYRKTTNLEIFKKEAQKHREDAAKYAVGAAVLEYIKQNSWEEQYKNCGMEELPERPSQLIGVVTGDQGDTYRRQLASLYSPKLDPDAPWDKVMQEAVKREARRTIKIKRTNGD